MPMTIGPLIAAVGLALMERVGPGAYVNTTFPAVLLFGLGLAPTVARLTSTVVTAAGPARAGLASAINTVIARAAGSIPAAILPFVAGTSPAGTGRA